MAYTRRNQALDIRANRAWTADAFVDLASIPAFHGDVAFVTAGSSWYFYTDGGTWHNLSGIATAIQSAPGAVTDMAAVRWDGTGGATTQDSSLVIDDDGDISSFGGQIAFPATQSASADANTLDDYEEGSFAPTSPDITFAAGGLRYQKIGSWVHIVGWFQTPVTADTNAFAINNFPFACANSNEARGGCAATYNNCGTALTFLMLLNTTTLNAFDATAGTPITNATMSNALFFVNFSYQAAN